MTVFFKKGMKKEFGVIVMIKAKQRTKFKVCCIVSSKNEDCKATSHHTYLAYEYGLCHLGGFHSKFFLFGNRNGNSATNLIESRIGFTG